MLAKQVTMVKKGQGNNRDPNLILFFSRPSTPQDLDLMSTIRATKRAILIVRRWG